MPKGVGDEGDRNTKNRSDDEDGNRADLSADGAIAHLGEDGGCEELRGQSAGRHGIYGISGSARKTYTCRVACVDNSEIHQNTTVDLPVREDAPVSPLIQTVHLRVRDVGCQSRDEELLLLRAQELDLFWPVRNGELARHANDNREEAFEDEAACCQPRPCRRQM
jgi:hypothetical protein